jgi:hypothetical protein
MNWKRIPTGDVPFDITRPTSGPYEPTRGELVLSDGHDVDLPEAEPDAVVAVATVGDKRITVDSPPSSRVCNVTSVELESRDPVVFAVADGNWHTVRNDAGVRPTDMVSYTADGQTNIRDPEGLTPYINWDDVAFGVGNGVAHTDEYFLKTSYAGEYLQVIDQWDREFVTEVTENGLEWMVSDGEYAYITVQSDNDIFVYSLDDVTRTKTLTEPGGQIMDLEMNRSQDRMLAGSSDGNAYLYDPDGSSALETFSHFSSYQAVAITDNYALTTAGKDIRIYELSNPGTLYWEYSAHNSTGSSVDDLVARTITDTSGGDTDVAFFGGAELTTYHLDLDAKEVATTYTDEPLFSIDNFAIGERYVAYSDGTILWTRAVDNDSPASAWSLVSKQAPLLTGLDTLAIYPK